MGSSSYPSSCYWGSTVLTTYARAAITSPEVLKEEEGELEAVLTVLPAAECSGVLDLRNMITTEKHELWVICLKCCLLLFSYF